MYYSLQNYDHVMSINNDRNSFTQNNYIQEYNVNEYSIQSDAGDVNLLYTMEVFVNAIIPRTPKLAVEFGRIQYYGALDLQTDVYIVWILQYYYSPFMTELAPIWESAANQFLFYPLSQQHYDNTNHTALSDSLTNDTGSFNSIIFKLIRYTMMGYYSEWYGYGKTRLLSPNQRTLQFYPLSWKQIGYPGPSLGYRALRESFL